MLVFPKMFFVFFVCNFKGGLFQKQSIIYGSVPVNIQKIDFSNRLPVFTAGSNAKMNLYGNNLNENLHIGVSEKMTCEDRYVHKITTYSVEPKSKNHVAVVSFLVPPAHKKLFDQVRYYFCLKDSNSQQNQWAYQGVNNDVGFYVYEKILTFWHFLLFILLFFSISALMTGLNIGLMGLDVNELNLLKNAGTLKERKYAAKIIPVRRKGNYLLCSIVITSTLCNAIATVLIGNFLAGVVTGLITTCIIVLFCEILPQAICTSYPLATGARTLWITKTCMILTIPVSYPLSKILNIILKKELKSHYGKERLKELLKVTTLKSYETKMISGALDLVQKKVEDIMTRLDDVFKLPITAVLDFTTIVTILQSGYSRIPIYVGSTSNIRYVLYTKDLAVLDPDDNIPVQVMVQQLRQGCPYIPVGTYLDDALGLFKQNRVHMGFVVDHQTHQDEKDKHVIGLITFEDIVEEVFQEEIIDETDIWTDNRTKKRVSSRSTDNLYSFLENTQPAVSVSANLKLATFQFLLMMKDFSTQKISAGVLKCLLGMNVYYLAPGKKVPKDTIYVRGVPARYFIMVIEGLVEVKFNLEELKFEAGPFKYFGLEALQQTVFTPNYTIQAIKQTIFLKIQKVQYDAAIAATRFERFKEEPNISTDSEMYKYYSKLTASLSKSRKSLVF